MKAELKRSVNGVELWVRKVGAYRYVEVKRAACGRWAARFTGTPYKGRLLDLYARFEREAPRVNPDLIEGDEGRASWRPVVTMLEQQHEGGASWFVLSKEGDE